MVHTPKYVIHLKFNCTSPTNKEMGFRIKHKSRLKKKNHQLHSRGITSAGRKSQWHIMIEELSQSITENPILPRYSLNCTVSYPDEQGYCHSESMKKGRQDDLYLNI